MASAPFLPTSFKQYLALSLSRKGFVFLVIKGASEVLLLTAGQWLHHRC